MAAQYEQCQMSDVQTLVSPDTTVSGHAQMHIHKPTSQFHARICVCALSGQHHAPCSIALVSSSLPDHSCPCPSPQVHDAILTDLVYPTEIVGKRIRYRVDASKILKVGAAEAGPADMHGHKQLTAAASMCLVLEMRQRSAGLAVAGIVHVMLAVQGSMLCSGTSIRSLTAQCSCSRARAAQQQG